MPENSPLQNFINNTYVDSTATTFFDIINPVDESVVGRSPASTAEDIDAAYAAARSAATVWGRTTPSARQQALLHIADAVEANRDRLIDAQVITTGQPRHLVSTEEVDTTADQLRFFAGSARVLEGRSSGEYLEGYNSQIRREPLGVVGQVTPWNYPLMIAAWKIGPALAAGNTVVLKPSDTTPLSTLLLAEIAAEFLPAGTFNVVLGDAGTGELVASHRTPSLVSITGSVRAGIEVAVAAARNLTRAHLELGGKAPVIVFEDADLDVAAETIATTGLFNAGQDCTAATRVLVAEGIHDVFVDKLLAEVAKVKVGDPDDEDVLYGPLNNPRQLERVAGFIERLPGHATIATGGSRIDRPGYFFEPTVITGLQQDDEAIQQEIFGPVITVQSFRDDDDALDKANDVDFSLSSSVWTSNHKRVLRFTRDLDFGAVWVNTHIPLTAEMPHGGFDGSGYGKDLSMYSLEEYTRVKHIMSATD
ncbi:gamma-aminobutyraldehyde dehydrogenase [Corynebacterium pacaense]|uniref:gamma-aminobutyraldehyde dehydrogenase n=1 Tax=Corynebacterium pacaense TaxID=1816684 RepID=UPI0009BA9532|nr:gamma-aminobutyraldehyde dehydrogenase [Corynebacterium pacaense]